MELITMIAMFTGSALLALIGGVLIGRGDPEERPGGGSDDARRDNTIHRLEAELSELRARLESPSTSPNKFEGGDTEVIDRSTADQLEAEVELLRTELALKSREVDKLESNNNRLGSRILEVENELQQKQAEVMKTVIAKEKETKSELIKEGMDSFLDALQKESDVLRGELENAYRMINRQERELARLRGDADDGTMDNNQLYDRIERLTEQNDQLFKALGEYEEALRNSGEGAPDAHLAVGLGKKATPPPPPPKESKPIYASPKEKDQSSFRSQKSISSFRTVRNSIIPDASAEQEMPPKDQVVSADAPPPPNAPPRKSPSLAQRNKTIIPARGLPDRD